MLNDVGEAARTKAVAPLGDALWHPNERVERVEPIVMRNAGVDEEMFLIYTTSENILKARVNGRILLARSLEFLPAETKQKIQSLIDMMGAFGCPAK